MGECVVCTRPGEFTLFFVLRKNSGALQEYALTYCSNECHDSHYPVDDRGYIIEDRMAPFR